MPLSLQVSFDLSLARGLDYYTGVIYEAILTGGQPNLKSKEKGEKQIYIYSSLLSAHLNTIKYNVMCGNGVNRSY